MNEVEEFVRASGYKHLLYYAKDGNIEVKEKYTVFVSKSGAKLKIKNNDILAYDYLRAGTDIQLETFFKPVRTGFMRWLLGE